MSDLEDRNKSGYEKRDVNVTKVILWGLAGIVAVVIIFVVISEYFLAVKEDYYDEMVLKPRSEELLQLREREAETLKSYKLLDKDKGVYQIPIRKAMELIAEEAKRDN